MTHIRNILAGFGLALLVILPVVILPGMALRHSLDQGTQAQQQVATPQEEAIATEDASPEAETTATEDANTATPTPTVTAGVVFATATNTLRPPPTFEPPSPTPSETDVPPPSATPTFAADFDPPAGLNGLETATPTSTPGCEPRADWQLTYEVQNGDALASIAAAYGTDMYTLADGNCLEDMNVLYVGQTLRVPGDAHPVAPAYVCAWELLTPVDWAVPVPHNSQITFNWRGPDARRNLLRIFDAGGSVVYEETVDLRQNITINASDLPEAAGTYHWYIYPLDINYRQIDCIEGGPWHFGKEAAPSGP